MAQDDQGCLQKLKSMREEVNWENEDERREFLSQLEDLISDWEGRLPNLREIFQPYDIDWLLAETVKKFDFKSYRWYCNSNLVQFVIDTGYKDEPDVDEDGKPLLQRTTAIHYAARKQLFYSLPYYLFDVYDRFDVNYTDDSGLTHFHFACMSDCDVVAKQFLELGQDPNLVWQETGDSPLHLALKHSQGRGNVVGLLLRSGADLSLINKDGDNLLHLAAKHRHEQVAELLQRRGADLSLANRNGETPLHLALKHRHEEIAASMLRSGTDLSLTTNDGLTHLHFICSHYYYKNSDLLEMFFKINDESNQLVQVNARDNKGNTALHLAVRHSNGEVVKFLLRRDANPNLANAEGLTPMHIICQKHYNEGFVEILFDLSNEKYRPLQIDVRDKLGQTPLHYALKNEHKHIAQLLMRYGVDSNLANADGLTPLQIICKNYCNDELVEIFLKTCDDIQQTVQVDVVDKLGRTPLQCAVASLMPNTVDSLLSYGANLSSFDFPTEEYFGEKIEPRKYYVNIKLRLASRALAVCESLEMKGYELDQNNALIMVIKLLTKNRVFDKSADFSGFWHGDEEFARDAREQPVCRSLSLYDVIQWSPEETLKRLKYKDYFEISTYHWIIPKKNWEACELHLCEMMSRGFLRGWATIFFMELTRCKLPFDCCKMIVEQLINKDLCNICLATSG